MLAGKLFDIAVRGTHAHAFVMAYSSLAELNLANSSNGSDNNNNNNNNNNSSNYIDQEEFVQDVLAARRALGCESSNEGELAAFIAYALAFPDGRWPS